jgi:hypothetical protein
MTRKYSTTSVATSLTASIASGTTTIVVPTGAGSLLMGGVSLAPGNVDQFLIALDVDTNNEEIVAVTAISGDTLTIVRAQAGTSAIAHTAGASVKHVFTGDDATFYTTSIANSVTLTGTQTLTNKTLTTPVITSISNSGTVTIPSGTDTLVGRATTDTLTNKTLTGSIFVAPEERTTISATAATGTINFDAATQSVLYYTVNASANWTLNIRGTSGTTLTSMLAVGDSITVVFLNTNGATAYYPTVYQIDGAAVTPKWQGGSAPSTGNASSIDSYSLTIIKTAATPTYTVLGSQTKFA